MCIGGLVEEFCFSTSQESLTQWLRKIYIYNKIKVIKLKDTETTQVPTSQSRAAANSSTRQ